MTTRVHRVCPVEHAGAFDRWYRYFLQNPYRMLSPYVKPGMTVLDIGCGPGYFSIPMAKLVGETGKVIAADVQQGMLDLTEMKAREEGMSERIALHLTEHATTGVKEPLDFVLAFYMVHEVPDNRVFLREIYQLLKPGGHLFVAEPAILFLLRRMFQSMLNVAESVGFQVVSQRRSFMARSSVLVKPE